MKLEEMKKISELEIQDYINSQAETMKKAIEKAARAEVEKTVQTWIDAHDISEFDAEGIMPEDLSKFVSVDLETLSSEIFGYYENVNRLVARTRAFLR